MVLFTTQLCARHPASLPQSSPSARPPAGTSTPGLLPSLFVGTSNYRPLQSSPLSQPPPRPPGAGAGGTAAGVQHGDDASGCGCGTEPAGRCGRGGAVTGEHCPGAGGAAEWGHGCQDSPRERDGAAPRGGIPLEFEASGVPGTRRERGSAANESWGVFHLRLTPHLSFFGNAI